MDILEFEINPRTEVFERNGKAMNVTFNADAFTPEYYRNVAKRFRELKKKLRREDELAVVSSKKARKAKDELETIAINYDAKANLHEAEREIYAIILTGTPEIPVLMEWELTRKVVTASTDGSEDVVVEEPIPVTEEELLKLKPQLVLDLYIFCSSNSGPKSPLIPTTQTSQTISESTEDGSSPQEIQPAANQTM